MKKIFAGAIILVLFSLSNVTYGQNDNSQQSILSSFRAYKDIGNVFDIVTPTVVDIPFTDFLERSTFAVFDVTTNSFEPYVLKKDVINTPILIAHTPPYNQPRNMMDNNLQTYSEFQVSEMGPTTVQIGLTSDKPITSSALSVLLENNVALPNFIEIRAIVNNQNRIVLAQKVMDASTVYFPRTTSSAWTVTFTYSQPLRITELRLQDESAVIQKQTVRFLAQPNHSYKIYFDPDRAVAVPVGEIGNLLNAQDVVTVSSSGSMPNPLYVVADIDNDTIPDILDNCVTTANTDQEDVNRNGRGDVCDDFDQDGILNLKDNCQDKPNLNQIDTDGDQIGDVCDGEESRITERYAWIPWAGMGLAALILIGLLVLTLKSPSKIQE